MGIASPVSAVFEQVSGRPEGDHGGSGGRGAEGAGLPGGRTVLVVARAGDGRQGEFVRRCGGERRCE